jgi:sarcosine oxidase subunit gamma
VADPPTHLSALGAAAAAHRGTDVVLRERRPLSLIQVAVSASAAAAVRGVLATLGLDLPLVPNSATGDDARTVLWTGAGRWLVAEATGTTPSWPSAIAALPTAVTDLGHARTVLRLAGPAAPALLAKDCGLDLHPGAFPPGACAQTLFAHVSVLLHAIDDAPTFDLYVPRSYARHLWELLADAADGRASAHAP